MKFHRILLLSLGFAGFILSSSCVTIWDSIKDRYKPSEIKGMDGDKVIVQFTFDQPSATSVWLAGQFNGWCATASAAKYPDVPIGNNVLVPLVMDEKTKYWTVTVPLAPGRYQYKYVLDAGRVWSEDMNTDTVDDGFGGRNSIIVVIGK